MSTFIFSALPQLKEIEIGENSMTSLGSVSLESDFLSHPLSLAFDQLRSVTFHSGSLSVCTELSLANLPVLSSLIIGHSCFIKADSFTLDSEK